MKAITIWLINKCNFNCYYCSARQGIEPMDHEYPPDGRVTRVNNRQLLAWLDRYLDPGEWLLELTGGEPGLYPEIDTLIPELTGRGYHGIIQTNGSLQIPKSNNFVRTAAWHGECKPSFYDKIIIIKDPKSNWIDKAKWCKENNISFRLIGLNETFRGKPPVVYPQSKGINITHYAFINAYGQLADCWKGPFYEDYCIRDMSLPPDFDLRFAGGNCTNCVNVRAIEIACEDEHWNPFPADETHSE